MPKILLLIIPAVLILGLAAYFLSSNKSPGLTQTSTPKGVSLSPKSYQGTDFTSFFDQAQSTGSILSWAGDWNELSNPSGSPAVVVAEASKHSLTPVIMVTAFTEKNGALTPIRPITSSVKQSYSQAAADFVKKYNLKYFGVGVEVNRIKEASANDYGNFVSLFNDTYLAVKAVSPTTQVFTVWQLEKIKGLNGGLYGGMNDVSKNEWGWLADFAHADFFAFTTYPGLIYKDPNDIPTDYYSEIKAKTAKPVAFSEIGWGSDAAVKGYESSEDEQSRFVGKFGELVKSLSPKFSIWSFLYDQSVAEPFSSMGMIDKNGHEKQSLSAWKNLQF